ncbi:hypothetical protein LSAT2_009971 [Lamellibrachia satsuma]|nr:hypothetical protein LSAT2_009971 [Lamellibrachia satsuma]
MITRTLNLAGDARLEDDEGRHPTSVLRDGRRVPHRHFDHPWVLLQQPLDLQLLQRRLADNGNGEVDDKWREQTADREKWKTSGWKRLPIRRSGRQVKGESCRYGEVEDK